jgi:regulator of nucleoside diphosphate kinase
MRTSYCGEYMERRPIVITEQDLAHLRKLIELARQPGSGAALATLEELEAELARAQVVPSDDIPHDVITMNSTACLLDLDTGEEEVYTLVFPQQADIAAQKISVLAPIGTAMLGYRVGDSFDWRVPDGLRRLQVKAVIYQPEAAGAGETGVSDLSLPGQELQREALRRANELEMDTDD